MWRRGWRVVAVKPNDENGKEPAASGVSNKPASTENPSALAKQRWAAAFRKVTQENAISRSHRKGFNEHPEGLIEEIKKAKQRSRVKENVLSILKTQANLTEKVFERQKYSAKEILIRKRAANAKDITGLCVHRKSGDLGGRFLAQYDQQCQLRYEITPEIQKKMDKIKEQKEAAAVKKGNRDEDKASKFGILWRIFSTTIVGQTLKANPRFYKMDPHEHLPELCRRCRRPLVDTLEARFTSTGILFCLLLPIIGILLLYANREFMCVICQETYVYGDLTARPDEDYYDDDDEGGNHKN